MTATSTKVRRIGVGIDTARYGHRVTFLREDKQPAAKAITILENHKGYQDLKECLERLQRKDPEVHFHVHIDAAGQYATNLERFLRSLSLSLTVSIGEPARNKNYQNAFSPKRTCDDTESRAMARFGVVEQPPETPAIPDEFRMLREIVSRLEGNIRDTTRAINRLHNLMARVFPELATIADDFSAISVLKLLQEYPTAERIAAADLETLRKIPYLRRDKADKIHAAAKHTVGSLKGEIAEALVKEIVQDVMQRVAKEKNLEKLLERAYGNLPKSGHIQVETITGIGVLTAAVLVAKIVSISRFAEPKNLVGYFGVFPVENTSGVDRWGKPVPPGTMHMSAKGCDIVRRYLWNSTKCAIRCNPPIRALFKRLVDRNVRGDVALGHCMRKMLHLVFAVWATNAPFDPKHFPWEPADSEGQPQVESPTVTTSDADKTQGPQQEAKKAAGHKREDVPASSEVTATTCKLEQPTASVKRTPKRKSESIDYAFVRRQITMQQVLEYLGLWEQLRGSGSERRGPCPLHNSQRPRSRNFAVNVDKNTFCCHAAACKKGGNVLDFWAAYQKLELHPATKKLAEVFNLELRPDDA